MKKSLHLDRQEFTARYWVESPEPLARVAEVIAGEQSSGTFVSLPQETEALKERSRARVLSVEATGTADSASLHSEHMLRRFPGRTLQSGYIEIAFPTDNIGNCLASMLTTVAGNLYELGEVTGLRLLDLHFPADYESRFPGPQFGVAGTRKAAGIEHGPLIGTIIKPSIGLLPEQTADLVDALAGAGIDFIKDDELTSSPAYAPFEQRLRAVMPVIHRHADRRGRSVLYAINISGTIEQMQQRYEQIVEAGGNCVMVNINAVGMAGVLHLRSYCRLPIHAHRSGWGSMTRSPALGMGFDAYQKLWRMAGVDQLHVNALQNKFWESDDSVISAAQACLQAESVLRPLMPVFSSGQWAGLAQETFRRLGSANLIHLAGGGIIGHPDGVASGVLSMREGWDAALQGIDAATYALDHPALAAAMRAFGTKP